MNTYALIVLLMGTPNNITVYMENKAVCDAGLETIGHELKKSNTGYKAFCIPTAIIKK
jgi:hypothetical protein